MTTLQHHVVTQTHTSSNHLDNQLDALLDDLQTSVSRSGPSASLSTQNEPLINGSSFGGHINLPPGASGYREITTTVTRDTNGMPMTSREYQIEYLNPANSVTVLDDRASSPALDLLKTDDVTGQQVKSYKTEVYDYKFSKTTTDRKVTSGHSEPQSFEGSRALIPENKSFQPESQSRQNLQYLKTENFQSESNVGKNLNELDILLKELNNSPSGGVGAPKPSSKKENVQTIEIEKTPERFTDSNIREISYSEKRNRGMRAQSPAVSSKSTAGLVNVQREYNTTESKSHISRRGNPSDRSMSAEMSPILRRRTPSPSSGEFRPSNFNNYPISPKDLTPTRTVTKKSYSYSSTNRRTPTPTTFDEPQPYRSPSPVSFPQKPRSPSPARKTLSQSDSGRSVSYQVSPPMSENPTVITYKYSSNSRELNRYPGGNFNDRDKDEAFARPFPTSTPIPVGEQDPPKKLDELMASFQDHKSQGRYYPQSSSEYRHHVQQEVECHEKQGRELQRSPSFEKNLRPSNVKVSQSYSQQQQLEQQEQLREEHRNKYQHREHYSHSQSQGQCNQQRGNPGEYHREFERAEEYQTRSQPLKIENRNDQYQQQREEHHLQSSQYQHRRGEYQQHNDHRQHYQQHQEGYQREYGEQFRQSQEQYHQDQRYPYQQHQQQNSFQNSVTDSASSSQAFRSTSASRSVAGPPVYYPPGVELFTKKEEAMLMQEQSGGKGKSKGKSKSKYEKSEKNKDKGKKMAGAPVCLPVCCAMPCSIM